MGSRPSEHPWRSALARFFGAPFRIAVGATLSQFFLGSFVVLGWAQRAAQRAALRRWWSSSALAASDVSFEDFALSYPDFAHHQHWPRWFLGDRESSRSWPSRIFSRFLGSLLRNARLGCQTILNTWVLTLPGSLAMAVSWSAGWQNSFNKGYENAPWGPAGFIAGMILFSLAMGYVPLAQARQAITGNWKSFYDFRILFLILRRRGLAGFGLAAITALASAAAALLKMAPFLFQYFHQLNDLAAPQALVALERYFWGAGAFLLCLLVLCRTAAARVYADGLREAFQRGAVGEEDLSEFEWHALHRLGLLEPKARLRRGWFFRLAGWLATRTGQLCAGTAVFTVWFAMCFWLVVSEFMARTEAGRGWLNQPLIQLPWFNYTPSALRDAAKAAEHAGLTLQRDTLKAVSLPLPRPSPFAPAWGKTTCQPDLHQGKQHWPAFIA